MLKNIKLEDIEKLSIGAIIKTAFVLFFFGIVAYYLLIPLISSYLSKDLIYIGLGCIGIAIVIKINQNNSVTTVAEKDLESTPVESEPTAQVEVVKQVTHPQQSVLGLPPQFAYAVIGAAICFFLLQGRSDSSGQMATNHQANTPPMVMQLAPAPTATPLPTPVPTPEQEKAEENKPGLLSDIMKQIWKHTWDD